MAIIRSLARFGEKRVHLLPLSWGRPVPTFSSALSFMMAYQSCERFTGQFTQAQRDYLVRITLLNDSINPRGEYSD